MKKLHIVLIFSILLASSCRKEKCKECFIDETTTATDETKTTSLGKKCGDDLNNTDGREYVGIDGPARSYCK